MKKMKSDSLMIIVLLIGVAFLFCGCSQEAIYTPGTYTNSAEGYYSTLNVAVTVSATRILKIEIVSHEEPAILAEIVFDELPPQIIKNNSAQVDVISGATYTSTALLEAVQKALDEAYLED